MLRKTHLVVGMLCLIVFALQGQYMDQVHNHLVGMDDGPRMLYRSSHNYLLLVAVLNVVLGVYLSDDAPVLRPGIQAVVSAVLLLSPVGLVAGFFLEPAMSDFARPYTRPVLYALFGTGVVLSLLAITGFRRG